MGLFRCRVILLRSGIVFLRQRAVRTIAQIRRVPGQGVNTGAPYRQTAQVSVFHAAFQLRAGFLQRTSVFKHAAFKPRFLPVSGSDESAEKPQIHDASGFAAFGGEGEI